MRTYCQSVNPDILRDQLGNGVAAIGEIIPEVLELLSSIEPAPAMEPDQAGFRLFDSITGFFKKAFENVPILLVIDDLHWADRPSLLLLEFLARQLEGSRTIIIGTYRGHRSPSGNLLGRVSGPIGFPPTPAANRTAA